ncbi:MAG: NAD-dependent epimerase/dehydratase family protein [Candidatus Jordarchaeaceae archaeon]
MEAKHTSVLVTGCAGLVGSEACKLFFEKGWKVLGVDSYIRGKIFGKEGETSKTMTRLLKEYPIEHFMMDIRDEHIIDLIKKVDVVVHTAAQPSHPKSIEIPIEDFSINAYGTLFLLENLRIHNKNAIFIFCSTNKVYGDKPNYFAYHIVKKRFEPVDPMLRDGFDEHLGIDQTMHTPFGISKVAADLYVQEYSRLYGLKTGVFRMGCITGGYAMAVEQHNWEPYFVRKALKGERITIYGYNGYQVRDVIHARDLVNLFYEFIKDPRPGEVYNVGGGRSNSISLLEAIDLIEEITKQKVIYDFGPKRDGDHIWYISNLKKLRSHYQNWSIKMGLKAIFEEIYESNLIY